MTINLSDNSPRISYSVSQGVTQSTFTVPFEFFAEESLNVYVDNVLKTLTTHYTTTGGNGSTGTVVISVTGASGGSTVVITREIPLERTADFPTSGPFQISALNTELDRIIAIAADLNDRTARSIRAEDFDATVSYTLPSVDVRKGTVLAFNATSGDVEVGPQIANVQSLANISADIALLADIQDGTTATNAITNVNTIRTNVTTVSGISANVTTVAGVSANVTTVAGISANVTTVAGVSSEVATLSPIATDITTVASNNTNVTTVATNINAVNTVASNITNINTVANDLLEVVSEIETVANDLNEATSEIEIVANNIANVNTVGTISGNVTTVAGISADVTAVAADAGDIGTVAANIASVNTVSGVSANVTTVAGISANVTTVAGISADISTVANTDLTAVINNSANIATVGTSIANVNTVAANVSSVTNVSSNISSVNSFSSQYTISASEPSSPNEGLLWFDTSTDTMKVYNGSSFQNAGSSVNGTSSRGSFTATAGQTSFATTGYDSGYIDVYLNGVKLILGTDFTATGGTNFVLTTGAALNDTLDYVAYGTFNLADVYTKTSSDARYYTQTASDARYLPLTGGTVSGGLVVSGNLTVSGTTTTVNSTTLDVADLNITVANGAADATAANGAGLTVDGASATFNYAATGDKWTMNKPLDVTGGVSTTDDIRIGTATNTTKRIYALGGSASYALNSSGGAAIAFNRDASNNDEIAFETHAQGAAHSERMRIGNYGQLGFNGPNYGASGEVLTSNGSAAAPSWQTVGFTTNVVTTNTTATKDNHYYLNGATLILTLPASPSVGDEVRLSEVAGNTNCIVGRNGSNIMGDASDLTIDSAYLVLSLRYVDATIGWAFS